MGHTDMHLQAKHTADTLANLNAVISNLIATYGGIRDIGVGTYAQRPSASLANRFFLATDEDVLYRDNGASWETVINKFGNVNGGNYSEFEADGTLKFNGNATVWDDVNLGGATLGGNPASQPDVDEIDGSSGGTGVYTYAMAIGEELSGVLEIPHWYKEGSDFVMHVHWSGNDAPTGTDYVKFELEYFTVKDNAVIGASTTIVIEGAYDTQYERVSFNFPTISGTGIVMGEQLGFTLRRVASTGDAYAGDVYLHTVGGHFERDTIGSRQITTK